MVNTVTGIPQRRHLVTDIPGPKSQALAARRRAAVAAGVSSVLPVYIERGEGAIVVDVDGNSLIDLGSGIAVTSIGHAVPALVEAVKEQAGRFTHTCFMVGPYEGYVAVCERLNALTPGEFPKTSALFNSGAEAVENAVKIARHATRRQAVIVFDHAYHGRTNLTMALTAKNMPYKDGFGPFAPEVYRMPMSYPFRDPPGYSGAEAAARALELIEKQVGPDNVACILIEPVQGEGGFVVPAPGFLPALAGVVPGARRPVRRRRSAIGLLPHRSLVRVRARGGRPRPGRHGQGHRRRHAAGRSDRPRRDHGARARRAASAAPMAETRSPVRPPWPPSISWPAPTSPRRPIGSDRVVEERLRSLQAELPAIGDVRGRGAMQAIELVQPGHDRSRPVGCGGDCRGLSRPGRGRADLRDVEQRHPAVCRRSPSRRPSGRRPRCAGGRGPVRAQPG